MKRRTVACIWSTGQTVQRKTNIWIFPAQCLSSQRWLVSKTCPFLNSSVRLCGYEMSTYVSLGPRGPVTGVLDETGFNPGNWTVAFDPNTMNCNVPLFEVCHIVINGAAGSSFSVYVDLAQWDTNQNGFQNSWDPSVPLPIKPGQYLYFYWSDPVTDLTPPKVTVWLRYDQDITVNQRALLGAAAQ